MKECLKIHRSNELTWCSLALCMLLAENWTKPTGVIVCFIPDQFKQLDMKALRNEATEQKQQQQTLHRKTQRFNLQELHNFSKLTLFRNICPDFLPLTYGRKQQFHLTVFLMANINHHLSLTALRDSILYQFVT